jgi:pimeloyl-ACP methyl ester carboxylesterase
VPFPAPGRFPVLLALLLVAVGCAGSGSSVRPTPQADRSTLPWEDCGEGLSCATLTVPVDHDHPGGPTLDLAVARRPAADPDARLGALVLNPGGPGAAGTDLVRTGLSNPALARFDLVSWDPRGTGASRPLACDGPVGPYRQLDWTPDEPAEATALDDGARAIAEGCRRAADDLADHLGTADTVHDLDALRAALGEERLTYLGFSYGSAIALQYAAQYPARVRALVLDGIADPRDGLEEVLGAQAQALEAHLTGSLGPDVAARYDRVVASAEAGRAPVTTTTVAFAAIAASYAADRGPDLASALVAAERGDGRRLQELADGYWAMSRYGPYAATVCTDQAHPGDAQGHDELVARLTGGSRRFGAVMGNELRSCAWWPPADPPPRLDDPAMPPLLLLGNTGDVATPYAVATRVADAVPQAALVTYDGRGHTSFGRSDCVDEHVRRYLEDLVRPPAGTRCG